MKINFRLFLIALALAMLLLIGVCHAEDASFYVISYDGNGASISYDPQPKFKDVDITLNDDIPTWRGHVFLGWATSPDAAEAEYAPGATFSANEDTTLYAIWMDCIDLGTVDSSSTWDISYPVGRQWCYVKFQVAKDDNYAIRSTNEFYKNLSATTSLEWLYHDDFSEYWEYHHIDENGDEFETLAELKAGITYYLYYYQNIDTLQLEITDEVYTVSYDGNGATISYNSQPKFKDVDITLNDDIPTWRGHVFLGWSTSPDAAEAEYASGATFSANEDTTLYAIWMDCIDLGTVDSSSTWDISYPVSRQWCYVKFQVAKDDNYAIRSTNEFYKGTYATTSLEWLYHDDFSEYWEYHDIVKNGDEFETLAELKAGITYYLFYMQTVDTLQLEITDEVYTVSYDGNGATISYNSQPKFKDVDITLKDNTPIWRGHVFLGWATSPDAAEAEYAPGATFSANEDTTLYAIWMDCIDLGTINSSNTWDISYPVGRQWCYVKFQVVKDDNYTIRSANEFYKGTYATTSLEWLYHDDFSEYWEYHDIDKNGDEFETLVELKAGITYYLFYMQTVDTLRLEIIPQYPERQDVYLLLPQDLVTVEQEAFAGAIISEVEIPENVKSIESLAFANCSDLVNVIIHSPDVVIAEDAFQGCSGLKFLAPEGSTAETFAKAHNFMFFVLEE